MQNLVWTGFGAVGPGNAHAVRVCTYQEAPHLCFFQGKQMLGWAHGHGVILNQSYRIVNSVEAGGPQAISDMHEFYLMPDGKSALLTIYKRHQRDLSEWGIEYGPGWIQEGRFQEVDVKTGDVKFEWGSLDHVSPSESHVFPSTTDTSGNGREKDSPWDYFHINSVDKSAEGDYLISARHTSCIYKISGRSGEVLWRLHGSSPSFRNLDGLAFAYQHDARFVVDNEQETVLSLFDNASNRYNETKDHSAGMIVRIDHVAKTARLLKEFASPDKRLAHSQGNMQILDGRTGVDNQYHGNIILGWGNWAFWSESKADTAETVWYGKIADTGTMNYRAMKFNWTGKPITKPALWTYSKTGASGDWTNGNEEREGGLSWFISWNGATEVATWRLFGSAESHEGPWIKIDEIPKRGFETIHRVPSFYQFTYVEGVDGNGEFLGKSPPGKTFVPGDMLRNLGNCDDFGCAQATVAPDEGEEEARRREEEERLKPDEQQKRLNQIRKVQTGGGLVLGLVFLLLFIRFGLHFVLVKIFLAVLGALRSQGRGGGNVGSFPLSLLSSKRRKYPRSWNTESEGTEGLLYTPIKRMSRGDRPSTPRSPQVW